MEVGIGQEGGTQHRDKPERNGINAGDCEEDPQASSDIGVSKGEIESPHWYYQRVQAVKPERALRGIKLAEILRA